METVIALSDAEAKGLADVQNQIVEAYTRIGELFTACLQDAAAVAQAVQRRNQIVSDKVALNGSDATQSVRIDIAGKRLVVGDDA